VPLVDVAPLVNVMLRFRRKELVQIQNVLVDQAADVVRPVNAALQLRHIHLAKVKVKAKSTQKRGKEKGKERIKEKGKEKGKDARTQSALAVPLVDVAPLVNVMLRIRRKGLVQIQNVLVDQAVDVVPPANAVFQQKHSHQGKVKPTVTQKRGTEKGKEKIKRGKGARTQSVLAE